MPTMTKRTLSECEFDLDARRAKEAAQFITDPSYPGHPSVTMQETCGQMTLVEALVQPDAAEVDFDAPRAKDLYRPADSSF
jgi:hypothetical protein